MEETVAVDRLNPFVPQNVLAPVLFLQLLYTFIMLQNNLNHLGNNNNN